MASQNTAKRMAPSPATKSAFNPAERRKVETIRKLIRDLPDENTANARQFVEELKDDINDAKARGRNLRDILEILKGNGAPPLKLSSLTRYLHEAEGGEGDHPAKADAAEAKPAAPAAPAKASERRKAPRRVAARGRHKTKPKSSRASGETARSAKDAKDAAADANAGAET